MVLARAQVDNLSWEELIEELLMFSDIMDKFNGLNSRFKDFIKKYDKPDSKLISKNCNSPFDPSLFINGSMWFEKQFLFYKCRQLKNVGIFSFWFFNNILNVKLLENGPITKIFHISDLENLLQIDSIEELFNNLSS